ncbi:O-methyltransferase family 2 [Colletotrichum truncatum]|uniref:O-methyltransferase family 2 n=1 Tax=Colletotrichum truncatum TaxID=5467 RepID=A0ACC3ZD72_COLTU|nr:O-methyltransferase family 2 [Colletotrichum truncatum]KAF6798058.1 O-methyltransferase family 2 [Colletotrichum truncatum]
MNHLIEPALAHVEDILSVEQISEDLFKLSLTKCNRLRLFSEAIERLESSREVASLVMRNLQKWAPDVAKKFSRRTSDVILNTPFRLICSSSIGVPLDNQFVIRQYLAVSYSWHSPEWPGTPHSAPEPGGIWPIGKRFSQAILQLRGSPREGIWMDQICINQRDESEKQRSIAFMDIVYKTCRKLVVLLEDVELTDDEALVCEKYAKMKTPHAFDQQPQNAREAELLVSLYDKIAGARWWQRAWCFHEFVVGEPWSIKRHHAVHNTVFVLGLGEKVTLTIEWMALHAILIKVTVQLQHHTLQSKHLDPILSGFENRTSPLLDSYGGGEGSTKASFMARFNAVAETNCSMPGDRLCVCINLIGLGLAYFRTDEPSPDEVYFLSVLLALAAGETIPLSFSNMQPLMLDGRQSWLARSIGSADTTIGKFTLGSIKGLHSVSFDRMEIDMVFLGHSIEGCTEAELLKTYEIFPNVIKSTPPPLKANMPQRPRFRPDEDLDKPRRNFLAAVVSGGLCLAERLWIQLQREVVDYNYNTGYFADFTANQDLRPQADQFLLALGKKKPLPLADAQGFTIDAALAFITWITDPRSIYWISSLVARITCTRDGGQALLTGFILADDFAKLGAEVDMRVAVPADLLDGNCAWTRAWFLVPDFQEKRSAWRIVGKALLLGEPDSLKEIQMSEAYEEFDGTLKLCKKQTIVG